MAWDEQEGWATGEMQKRNQEAEDRRLLAGLKGTRVGEIIEAMRHEMDAASHLLESTVEQFKVKTAGQLKQVQDAVRIKNAALQANNTAELRSRAARMVCERALGLLYKQKTSDAVNMLAEFMLIPTANEKLVGESGENGESIRVTGRDLVKPVVGVHFSDRGLVLRIDDDECAATWVEVVISETRLLRLVARLHRFLHNGDLGNDDQPAAGSTIIV